MANSFTTTPQAATAIGYYTNQLDLQTKWGSINIAQWSNKDNGGTAANVAAVQMALNWTDNKINQVMRQGPYNVPLTPVVADLSDIAQDLAAYWLYTNRGLYDEKADKLGGKLSQAFNEGMNRLAMIRGGIYTLECSRRWPTPTAPVACG